MIANDAGRLCAVLSELDLEGVKIFAMRPGTAADESIVWLISGLDDQRLADLREKMDDLNRERRAFQATDDKVVYLSSTVAVADSRDPELQPNIQATREWMRQRQESGEPTIPWGLFEEVTSKIESDTKLKKVAKDIARLPIEEIGTARFAEDVKEILINELGDTRISTPLLRTAFSIIEAQTFFDVSPNDVTRESICNRLGIPLEQANALDASGQAHFSDEDLKVFYFDYLLHRTYEEHGHEIN